MKWIAFKDELPENGRMILYGNHRWVDNIMYFRNANSQQKSMKNNIAYKDVTHWCYIESPPEVPIPSKWTDYEVKSP